MKTLLGAWDSRPYPLLAEITALRTRIAELEAALERAERENAALRQARGEAGDSGSHGDDRQVALTS
ncbi:MAG: hypothetical protein KY434_01500 [Actinobacteria bacterium]|nr:hypothetical protein [Actinomycetota bacterium]